MADKRDYYEVLGVDKNADEAALKKAYRVLAKKFYIPGIFQTYDRGCKTLGRADGSFVRCI